LIPGITLVRDIPSIDGSQILLLWPLAKGTPQKWDPAFACQLDHFPIDATLEEELTPQESQTLLKRLGL